MNVGNIDLGGMIPSTSQLGGFLGNVLIGILVIGIVGGFGFWAFMSFKNKKTYNTKVTLTTLYDNGTKKSRYDLTGGKVINGSGVWDFRIRIPKQSKKKDLGYMPDFSKADSDGTVHFITSGDGTIWQQVEEKFITDETNSVNLIIKPIPTDIKTVTVNSIKGWSELINKNKLTVYSIAVGAFIIMVIAHLVSLYIQTKVKCGS